MTLYMRLYTPEKIGIPMKSNPETLLADNVNDPKAKVGSLTDEGSPQWLINFVDIYQRLSTNNLSLLEKVYHENITFIDPLHYVEGFDALTHYFTGLYEQLSQCDFVINNVLIQNNEAAIYWTMTYQHRTLNKGKSVTVSGHSHIKGSQDKVFFHRDYLDVGAMLYEQLPVVGRVIKWIKHKAAK